MNNWSDKTLKLWIRQVTPMARGGNQKIGQKEHQITKLMNFNGWNID